MMSPPHFGIHSKPFRPRFMAAQDLFHHAALIYARKKFTKTRSAADYFLLLLRHVGHEQHQTDAETAPNVYMYKNKTHDDGRTSKTGTCISRKKTSKDEVQIFSTQMRFLRVAVCLRALPSLFFSSAAELLPQVFLTHGRIADFYLLAHSSISFEPQTAHLAHNRAEKEMDAKKTCKYAWDCQF